ncbi:MAG: ABC transporter permease, partial [Gemmatimonadota bacterium]
MPLINRFGRSLRSAIWRPSVRDEVDHDLDFHVEMRTSELIRTGLAPDEARAEAVRRFGSIEQVKAECRGIGMRRERDMRLNRWWTDWRLDLRHAARNLLTQPGVTIAIVVTLGIGVGASTSIFSAVDSVLLRPLPFADQDRVVSLWQTGDQDGSDRSPVSPANFLDWRDRNQTFSALAEAEPWSMDLTGEGDPEILPTWAVTRDFFKTLGADPVLGRTFLPEEFEEGNDKVVVLSHEFWQRRFRGDSALVGSTLTLDDEGFLVAGVMPPDFEYPPGRSVWRPRVISKDSEVRGRNWLSVIGRLSPGVSFAEAQADMDRVARILADEYPDTNRNTGVRIEPIAQTIVGRARAPLTVLFAAAGLLLLIACTNVAGLLLARGARRERELTLRAALGAGRERLMRQLFTENTIYGALGGVAGVLLAVAGTAYLGALGASELPRVGQLQLDARVLIFAAAASVITVLLFGLGPAIHSSRPDLRSSLNEAGRGSAEGSASQRLRGLLVSGQIAITLVLLVAAGLLSR